MFKIILIVSILLFPGLISAQEPKPNTTNDKAASLQLEIIQAELDARLYALTGEKTKQDSLSKLAGLYRKALADPEIAQWLIASFYTEFNNEKSGARSAVQVSQVADEVSLKFQMMLSIQNEMLIEQNKRMIELLEKLANRRP